MLKRALTLACPPSLSVPSFSADAGEFVPDHDTHVAAARARLRESHALRQSWRQAVEREAEGTRRVRQVRADLADAEAALRAAEAAYVVSASEWAARGAHGDVIGDAELLAKCESARANVYRLTLAAKGADVALAPAQYDGETGGGMTAEEESARSGLASAERGVQAAVRSVLAAEIEPAFRRALDLHRELRELMPQLRGLERTTKQQTSFSNGPGCVEYADFLSAFSEITRATMVNESESVSLMSPWRSLGERLTVDPNAQLE